jgi:hypothetical protein
MAAFPGLAGVSFRTFAGACDYTHLARIICAHARGDENERRGLEISRTA